MRSGNYLEVKKEILSGLGKSLLSLNDYARFNQQLGWQKARLIKWKNEGVISTKCFKRALSLLDGVKKGVKL